LKLDIVCGICRVRQVRSFVALAALLGALGIGCGPKAVRLNTPTADQRPDALDRPPAIAFFSHPLIEGLAISPDGERIAGIASQAEKELVFHGHCQQKAEADATLSLELLRQAGFRAEMVAAPCCGMAGAFGFEREHYEASKRAFQRALGPAIAAHPKAKERSEYR
jgi:hypothetical protein